MSCRTHRIESVRDQRASARNRILRPKKSRNFSTEIGHLLCYVATVTAGPPRQRITDIDGRMNCPIVRDKTA